MPKGQPSGCVIGGDAQALLRTCAAFEVLGAQVLPAVRGAQ
jgi:hypothetical protein